MGIDNGIWILAAVLSAGMLLMSLFTRDGRDDREIVIGGGTEEQKCARRAEIARRYAREHPTINGNWEQ